MEEGGRVRKKKEERKKKGGGKKDIVERKTIHTGYEILIKLLRLYFFRRFGWIGARTYFFRGDFREKISSYLILLHGGGGDVTFSVLKLPFHRDSTWGGNFVWVKLNISRERSSYDRIEFPDFFS